MLDWGDRVDWDAGPQPRNKYGRFEKRDDVDEHELWEPRCGVCSKPYNCPESGDGDAPGCWWCWRPKPRPKGPFCVRCRNPFEPRHRDQKLCSKLCRKEYWKRRRRKHPVTTSFARCEWRECRKPLNRRGRATQHFCGGTDCRHLWENDAKKRARAMVPKFEHMHRSAEQIAERIAGRISTDTYPVTVDRVRRWLKR